MTQGFFDTGWCRFPHDPVLAEWVAHALPAARLAVTAAENAEWHRCQGTWFVGVNVLSNDARGGLDGGSPLAGQAVNFIQQALGITGFEWDRAQVSICYPGYPKPMAAESDANFAYRRDRDAAHVDGLRHVGPDRRRFLLEHHGFILGLPMVDASADAAPLVVWEGSHHIMRDALGAAFAGIDPAEWATIDITDVYHAARREAFSTCARVVVAARPGEAYLVHRLALHGMAPWASEAKAGPDGRMIVYFRPETGEPGEWLSAP